MLKNILSTMALGSLIVCTSAIADYRKALEAFQKREGPVLLAEVREAVQKNNDDGLIIFLNALAIDDSNSRYETSLSGTNPKSTIEMILNDEQQQEIRKLLDISTENSSPRAQWFLLHMPKFSQRLRPAWLEWEQEAISLSSNKQKGFGKAEISWMELQLTELEKIADRGSPDAASQLYEIYSSEGLYKGLFYSPPKAREWMITAARLGDPDRAFDLGLKKLHYESDYYSFDNCAGPQAVEQICFDKNNSEAILLFKQVANYFDQYPMGYGGYIYTLADIELKGLLNGSPNPRQAYLWCLYGINRLVNSSTDHQSEKGFLLKLKEMKAKGLLKEAAPELDAVWEDESKRSVLLHPKNLSELPQWIQESRAHFANERPVFSYIAKDMQQYAIDVYEDGRVSLVFLWNAIRIKDEETYMKVPVQTVEEFVTRLIQIGISDWPLSRSSYGKDRDCMDWHCKSNDYIITYRIKNVLRTVLMSQPRNIPPDPEKNKNIAKVFSLVEEFFPTQKLRCTLSSSLAFNQMCVSHDQKMLE